jgi:hypothetical protein
MIYVRTLLLVVAVLQALPAAAQTATLAGKIVDDSGAALPGVVVVFLPDAGANPRETTSDANGAFTLSGVPFGLGRIRAELSGFQTAEQKVSVTEKGQSDLLVRLKVGFDDEVTVSAESAGVLSPSRNANTVEFDPEALRRLPTDAQDLQALINNFSTIGPAGAVSVIIDGVETSGSGLPTAAIHRLNINKSPYATEYRSPGKSRVEVETERGSRRYFHGSGALFVRNSALDAKNAFALDTPDVSRTLAEGTLGGPLPQKGWSFFGTGQHLDNNQAAVVNAIMPSGAVRQNVATPERRDTALWRADFRPNKSDALTFKYDLFDDAERNHGIGGFRLSEQAYSSEERRHRFMVGDRRVFGSGLLNDLRVEAARTTRDDGVRPAGPALVVAGAFTAGVPQTFARDRATSVQAQEVATLMVRAREVRVGGSLKVRANALTDGENLGGTYEFRSLDDFVRGTPTLFSRRDGSPEVAFTQSDGSAFVETTLRPRDTVGITAGLRYDWQSGLGDWNNLSPRLALAFAPAGKTVFRVGTGIFYQTVSSDVFARARLFGDGGVREIVVANPSFPAIPAASAASAGAIWLLAADLAMPRTVQASASVERLLGRRTWITAEYLRMRSSNALRARDINAPFAGGQRPDPSRQNVFQIESTGPIRTDALSITFRGKLAGFKGTIDYTLSHTDDEASDAFDLPADSTDPGADLARADFDRLHRLNLAGAYGWKKDRIRLGAVFSAWSGAPFDILVGTDANQDLVSNDRPAGIGRNAGQGPGYAQIDLRFTTVFRMPRPPSKDPESAKREQRDNLELNVDVFNATNRVNPTTFVGVITSPLFGQANTARAPRTAQISLRYRF